MDGSLLPKLTYRPQHKLEVFFTGGVARITRDGKLLACSCGEEVKIVDVATGAVVRTLPGDSEPVTALAVSPDSRTLVVASRSLACRVYDLTTGELRRTWRAHKAPVADLAVDASGGYVATASADRSIKVWDLQGGFCTHSFTGHSGVVLRVLFHPKQLQLFSGGDDAEVRVWDLVEKKCVALLKSHFSAVTSLALSADGWVLLSGGRDKVVTAWDLRSHAKLATVPVFESVEGVVSLPPGSPFPGVPSAADPALVAKKGAAKPVFFATAGEKGRIKFWRSDTAACVYEDPGLAQPTIAAASSTAAGGGGGSAAQEYTDLVLVPGAHQLLATTADARLLFYQGEKKGERGGAPSRLVVARQLIGNVDEVTDVRLVGGSRDQPTHVAVATNCEVIHLFSLQGMSCVASCVGHRDTILCLDATFHPGPGAPQGASVLVSGAKDNEVRVWEVPSGRCLAQGVGHVGSVSAVALARKQPHKFAVSAGADKLLKVWDLASALEAAAAPPEAEAPAAKKAKKGEKGKAVAVAAAVVAGVVQMRVLAATAAHDKDINSVAVSPNDALVATGSQDRTARVWKLPALTPHLVLRGHKRGVWAVEFSPVDQALLTASGDKTIKMWSLAQGGACLRTLEGHQASVLRAGFITAGTQVLSAGADGLVKLWSLKSDECVSTFDEHQGKIWAMHTGGKADGMLVTGGSDACVCVWTDVTAEDARAAEEAAEALVGKEQDLANALADGDFVAAAKLAFELRHPGRLLAVVQQAAAAAAGVQPLLLGPTSQAVAAGQHAHMLLAQLVKHMSDEDVKVALEYCREWNTHTKHCHAAQAMLRALLRTKKPAKLLTLPGVGELVDGLLAYSGRHFTRIDRLLRSTRLLDYSLAAMKVFSPEGVAEEQEGEEQDAVEAAQGQQQQPGQPRQQQAAHPASQAQRAKQVARGPVKEAGKAAHGGMNGTAAPQMNGGHGSSSSSSSEGDSSSGDEDMADGYAVQQGAGEGGSESGSEGGSLEPEMDDVDDDADADDVDADDVDADDVDADDDADADDVDADDNEEEGVVHGARGKAAGARGPRAAAEDEDDFLSSDDDDGDNGSDGDKEKEEKEEEEEEEKQVPVRRRLGMLPKARGTGKAVVGAAGRGGHGRLAGQAQPGRSTAQPQPAQNGSARKQQRGGKAAPPASSSKRTQAPALNGSAAPARAAGAKAGARAGSKRRL